jgi:hypothetical protein
MKNGLLLHHLSKYKAPTKYNIMYTIFFSLKDHFSAPYIHDNEPIEYIYDGKEGQLTFDGYFHVDDHAPPYPEDDALPVWERPQHYSRWLPVQCEMYVRKQGMEAEIFVVEIYKRVIHESTDRISEIEEESETMQVCFMPTNRQTIYLRAA